MSKNQLAKKRKKERKKETIVNIDSRLERSFSTHILLSNSRGFVLYFEFYIVMD